MIILTDKKFKAAIKAARDEGQRSILFPPNINGDTGSITSAENEYTSYEKQVYELYQMYYAESQLGNDIARPVIDIRTAIIVSEGITVKAKNKTTANWINDWLKLNGLDSNRLINFVLHGELEGKQLIKLKKVENKLTKKPYVKAIQILWEDIKYNINNDGDDKEEITQITFKENDKVKNFNLDEIVLVKLSGKPTEFNDTPPRCANIIPQMKNYDKALYDLRAGNKLYGFPTPAFEAKDREGASETNTNVQATNWKPGITFAGTSKMYYPIPPASYETISKEMSLNAKLISAATGVLVHWMGWTDLMSNRATAEELEELLKNTTTTDRMIWAKGIKEMIMKAMRMSIDIAGDSVKLDDNFDIEIPYISLKYLQLLSNTWLPLQQMDVISMQDLRSKIAGINPVETEKQILKEKEENLKRMQESIRNDMIDNEGENQNNKEGKQDEKRNPINK